MSNGIERVTVLQGHVGQGSAYVVHDYPYGRSRTDMRYWVDTAVKGPKKGMQRLMSQSLDPKRGVWNKPHGSTYSNMVLLFLDPQDDGRDFVRQWAIHFDHMRPAGVHRTLLAGVYEQMLDQQRKLYRAVVGRWQRRDERSWAEWERVIVQVAAHVRDTGSDPEPVNGLWTTRDGVRVYLGTDAPVYFAVARWQLARRAGQATLIDTLMTGSPAGSGDTTAAEVLAAAAPDVDTLVATLMQDNVQG